MIQGSLVEVHLRGVPIDLWKRAAAHQEAIQREFEIMRASDRADPAPNRLLSLVADFDARYGDVSDQTREELRAAAERGEQKADVTFRVPPTASAAARELASTLAEVDEFCRTGEHLMTLATPPELVAFRGWFLDEFTRQIDGGEEPLSWEEYQARVAVPAVAEHPAPGGGGSDRIVFEGSLDLATAGELRDMIQERRAHDLSEIVVDLTDVGFVDSIGIGLLVTTHNRLEEEGVTMRLVVPSRLKELLRLSGLIDVLQPEDPAEPR
ncbi:MAG: STAS domain-containing protein [Acidimicrobiia bacterium]